MSQIIDKDKYQIVLVGVSDEQIRKMSDGMVGIKRTDNQVQLAELYSLAYAFVNFTYEDNFPTVNLEALACGTPIICYKTGGATEMLNEKNGIVLKQGDYIALSEILDKIEVLRHNKNIFAEEAHNKYSAEVMAKKYKAIYDEIVRW